jgi:uncharacterized protein HemY
MTAREAKRYSLNLATVAFLSVLFYVLLYLVPAVVHTLTQPPAEQSGYCPYTLYQQYHPTQFDIPEGVCK